MLQHLVAGAGGGGVEATGVDGRAVEIVIVGRSARHRQDLTVAGVEHDRGAEVGPGSAKPVLELLVRLLLEAEVEAEQEVGAGHRIDPLSHRDRVADRVDVDALVSVLAAKNRVVLHLEARPPHDRTRREPRVSLHVIRRGDPRKPEQRREQRSVGIGAAR